MKSRANAGLYVLLIVVATLSMGYYIAGALALQLEFFHASRYARMPFVIGDYSQIITDVAKKAQPRAYPKGTFSWQSTEYRSPATLSFTPSGSVSIQARRSVFPSAHRPDRCERRRFVWPPAKTPSGLWAATSHFSPPSWACPCSGPYRILGGCCTPANLNAWLVLLLLAFPETAFGDLDWSFWPEPWYFLLSFWSTIVQLFVLPALLWFGFLFPERWRGDLRLPWFKYAILAASCCAFVFQLGFFEAQLFWVQSIHSLSRLQIWTGHLYAGLNITCILLFLAALFDKLHSASTADARRRLRVLAIGSGLSLGPLIIIFAVVPLFGMDPHHGNWFSAVVPVLSIFPLTLAYVVIVQRAMDVRILLRMGTKYLLARATVVTAEIALVAFLILRFVVPMMQRKEHQLLNLILLAVCIAALFQVFIMRDSFSQRLQRWLDRKFFREAYNSEVVLSELSEQVRQLTDTKVLFDIVLRRISEVLHVSQIAILLRGSKVFHLQQALGMDFGGPVALTEESATIQNLLRTNRPATVYHDRPEEWFTDAGAEEKTLLREINAELLLPMSGRADLLGLIALGPKKSEEPYTPTDLRTLQSVAAQTGLTLEVAELVRTLANQAAERERMNREIEIAREVQQRLFPQSHPSDCGSGPGGNVPSRI